MNKFLKLCKKNLAELIEIVTSSRDRKTIELAARLAHGKPLEVREVYFLKEAQNYLNAEYKDIHSEIKAADRLGFFQHYFLSNSPLKYVPIIRSCLSDELKRLSTLE